jgi:hypothetical protein
VDLGPVTSDHEDKINKATRMVFARLSALQDAQRMRDILATQLSTATGKLSEAQGEYNRSRAELRDLIEDIHPCMDKPATVVSVQGRAENPTRTL